MVGEMAHDASNSPVTVVIKAASQKYDDQTIHCFMGWTVEKLKRHLSEVYPSRPNPKDQRLVYAGKLLQDPMALKDVFREQREFHMLHLVCTSHTPPTSPLPSKTKKNPADGGSSAEPVSAQGSEHAVAQGGHSEPNQHPGPVHNHPPHGPTPQGWGQYLGQAGVPLYPLYTPGSLLWWQQVYAWQYYTHYQMWIASTSRIATPSSRAVPMGEEQNVVPDNIAGEVPNEEEVNRDWMDWVYTGSRAVILLSIVYFYSSFSRFLMVTGAMLLLYLHQVGWLPFNLEHELQNLGEPANQEEREAEPRNELQEMERVMDEGGGIEEQTEDPHAGVHASFLSSAWSFITTFFSSLIPEGLPNAAN
ncbi:homocysteine-responsive endoplasmic reticulum-resident ubiquitin-like domain member 2 protein [Chanos chanos]|uniref:Homocysteine-responsive endoplasmic reticulum-resident ubiquitin-like domain member 2 protein n=1 Tax=Chanos chanos TaxID=29144 RepID=A0A6J2WME6_CHACN|nr:homocysteine-responsive endoplasmic reticulum-resident ubiquitin-like domain member 2 protein [Chanos chanos]